MTTAKRRMLTRARLADFAPWFAAGAVAWSAAWASEVVKSWLDPLVSGGLEILMEPLVSDGLRNWATSFAGIVYLLFFFASVWWLYSVRKAFFEPRTRFLKNEKPELREHLVLFLSNLDPARGPYREGIPNGVTLSGDLERDLEELVTWKKQEKRYWSWEMPLRGIQYQIGKIKSVTAICSDDSIHAVHWFVQILGRYDVLRDAEVRVLLRAEPEVRLVDRPQSPLVDGGWNFEAFDDLAQALLGLIGHFRRAGIAERQIMIDFTGGQKVTSVVAAAVTFNRSIKTQYVQTNPPFEVVSYDILLGTTETGGLGM